MICLSFLGLDLCSHRRPRFSIHLPSVVGSQTSCPREHTVGGLGAWLFSLSVILWKRIQAVGVSTVLACLWVSGTPVDAHVC